MGQCATLFVAYYLAFMRVFMEARPRVELGSTDLQSAKVAKSVYKSTTYNMLKTCYRKASVCAICRGDFTSLPDAGVSDFLQRQDVYPVSKLGCAGDAVGLLQLQQLARFFAQLVLPVGHVGVGWLGVQSHFSFSRALLY